MLFRLLGPIEVHNDESGTCLHPRSAAQQALLTALLAEPGAPVDADRLMGEVWGDGRPRKPPNALQAHVSRLRRSLIDLEPGRRSPRLVQHGGGYVLRMDHAHTDVEVFLRAVARAEALLPRDAAAACAVLTRALELWRGPVPVPAQRGPIGVSLAQRLGRAHARATADLAVAQRLCGAIPTRPAPRASAAHPHPGTQLADVVTRIDLLAAEQRALRGTVDRLCGLVATDAEDDDRRSRTRLTVHAETAAASSNAGMTWRANKRIAADASR